MRWGWRFSYLVWQFLWHCWKCWSTAHILAVTVFPFAALKKYILSASVNKQVSTSSFYLIGLVRLFCLHRCDKTLASTYNHYCKNLVLYLPWQCLMLHSKPWDKETRRYELRGRGDLLILIWRLSFTRVSRAHSSPVWPHPLPNGRMLITITGLNQF